MTIERIGFVRCDRDYPRLEIVAQRIAEFLFKYRRNQFAKFCDLMRNSGNWTIDDYKNRLGRWLAFFGNKRKVAQDDKQFIELANDFFNVCRNNDEIIIMRGLVPEKLLSIVFQKRYLSKQHRIGFGSKVVIDGQEVLYECNSPFDNSPHDSDKRKITVDLGVWDGFEGEFVEIKLSPDGFHTKDIKYLRLLESECRRAKIGKEIYLIALHSDKTWIREKLLQIGLWRENEFKLLGREEIFYLYA